MPRGPNSWNQGLMSSTGGAVDGVEFLDVQIEGIDCDRAAARDAQPVQAAHVAIAEDVDFGPVRVVVKHDW